MVWLAVARMVIMVAVVLWYIIPGKEDDWWLGL